MAAQKGKIVTVSFLLADNDGNRIKNDSPVATVKDVVTGKFLNYTGWSADKFEFLMKNENNGFYTFSFTPTEAGNLEVLCYSKQFGKNYLVPVTVTDTPDSFYLCKTGEVFSIKVPQKTSYETGTVRIIRTTDGLLFNGVNWVSEIDTEINMQSKNNTLTCDFIPSQNGEYSIEIKTSEHQDSSLMLKCSDEEEIGGTGLNIVNSQTFLGNDNTPCRVVDVFGNGIRGVKVECVDMNAENKKIVATCDTDSDGNWGFTIPNGTYYFLFKKDGYISTGFERTVNS